MAGERSHAGLTVRVEKLVAGGFGLARSEGRVIFVPLAAPEDVVRVELTRVKPDFAWARIAAIETPSPFRREPACPYYGSCGGCDLMHLDYQAQLGQKEAIVRESFARGAGIQAPDLARLASPEFGYRCRFRFHRDAYGRPGFRRRQTGSVLPIERCLVACPAANRFLADYPAHSRDRDGGELSVLCSEKHAVAAGRDGEIMLNIGNHELACDAGVFFQGNQALPEKLARCVAGEGGGESAWDLYGGVGLFGVFLKESYRRVVLVEGDERAARLAERNLGPAHEVHSVSVENWLAGASTRIRPDLVVCDPPRSGLSPAVRRGLVRIGPAEIRYVSCDPVSLARDVKDLAQAGYALTELSLVDMFPQTSHIECVCTLKIA